MLTILSSAAAIIITLMLILSAWLSTASYAWSYNIAAATVIFLWAQPWRRTDPYRTSSQSLRYLTYLVILVLCTASGIFLARTAPFLLGLETIVLSLVEYSGRKASHL